jgi:hypothetical protein
MRLMLTRAGIVVAVVVALGATVGRVVGAGESASDRTAQVPGCAAMSLDDGSRLMVAYARAGSYPAVQTDGRHGLPARVSVVIPPIRFTGPDQSSTLPVGPCQHIYRFGYRDISAPRFGTPTPFRYAEIDWNTEGYPRGPNGSFVSAHFDFHLYLRSRRTVDATTKCVSTNGRTCDPTRTGYAQMRRFLALPPAAFVPPSYRPDVDSSIPLMGLHHLDTNYRYTVQNVNHHPVLLYGTFNGTVLFAEASVTLATLQDVIAAPAHTESFRYRQPNAVGGRLPWPSQFVIRYLPASGDFRAGFEGFRVR